MAVIAKTNPPPLTTSSTQFPLLQNDVELNKTPLQYNEYISVIHHGICRRISGLSIQLEGCANVPLYRVVSAVALLDRS